MKSESSCDQERFTDNTLLGGRVAVRQPTIGYRAAVDPVLLAAFADVCVGHRVLDAGCGTGAAMFCLAARVPGLSITGVEIQSELAAFAREGANLNKLEDVARIVEGDIGALAPEFKNAFDAVITNPPYGEAGKAPPDASLATAHMEGDLNLANWISVCLACLKQKGRLVVIHRADRLSDILTALHGKAGDVHILPVFPKKGEPARRVIVSAGKGRRSPDTVLPGLVLHEYDGSYTSGAEKVLREAKALPI
jgi:tRNA1(Val) A37 N6-methylase TrmN6